MRDASVSVAESTLGETPVDIVAAAKKSARSAGLRYVSETVEGIRRIRRGKTFAYLSPSGRPLKDPYALARIRSLAIPPAWERVWICPWENGHIQATGFDARGRKQYRYHPRWQEVRDRQKYDKLLEFARALPKIRERVNRDLARRGLQREKVLAAVVRLLELTTIRVGNDEYARQNASFGLTTMRNGHAKVKGSHVRFEFCGKHQIEHEISVRDSQLARVVRQCQELPGQELFEYIDDQGRVRDVTSEDVNRYLREIAGHRFSAKDFRTWVGTVIAAWELGAAPPCSSQAAVKRAINQAVSRVAERLGNTRAVCRKCYIHPAVIDSFTASRLMDVLQGSAKVRCPSPRPRLPKEEFAVFVLLSSTPRTRKRAAA